MFDFNDQTVSITSETIETVIGAQTRFKGNVKTEKPIRIDGYFEGDIDSTALIIISACGTFKGSIKCRELQLVGSGEGTVVCAELLQFADTGRFIGDVTTRNLITVPGSILHGSCKMLFDQK